MIVRWIGQSGYVVKTENTEIIIDPYLSDAVNRVAGRPRTVAAPFEPSDIKADAVLCSHDHLDHIDIDAIPQMPQSTHFITTKSGKEKINSLGQENVIVLNLGESVTVGDIKVTAVFADHTVEAVGFVINADGKTLYFSGDTLFNEGLFDIAEYKPDVTFICINGRLGNMNVEEAVVTAEKIGAKINVPNHYDMFKSNSENPEKFTQRLNNGFIMEFNREYRVAFEKLELI